MSVLDSRTACALGAKIRNEMCRSGVISGDVTAGACARSCEVIDDTASRPTASVWCCMQHRVYNGTINEKNHLVLCAHRPGCARTRSNSLCRHAEISSARRGACDYKGGSHASLASWHSAHLAEFPGNGPGRGAGLLPRRRRDRSTQGRGRKALRHWFRSRAARSVERAISVSGRRRFERQRGFALGFASCR